MEQKEKKNPFPLAPKQVVLALEMTAGAEFESYILRLPNGTPVYGCSNYDALIENLTELRDKFLLGKNEDE